MKSLLEVLEENNRIPMHMPGHKRNLELAQYLRRLAADLDITEIDGFDDLHNPEGILLKSMQVAARLRGADMAFYLVNGSTCGILAGICAVISKGDRVICARNCHKAVYNALELAEAEVIFVKPDEKLGICGEISAEKIKDNLNENPDVKLIILTSPTYEGVVSDVREVCRLAHEKDVPVLVDAAHGAHFGFGGGFAESATACGADIVIESLHKTLPSLTQTAACYLSGNLVDFSAVQEKLAMFETSSPSYLLMASIDGCMRLLDEKSEVLFDNWRNILDNFYEKARLFKNIKVFENDGDFFGFDRSKILIFGEGKKIAGHLRKCNIECEMTMPGYVVLMTGLGDTAENLDRLFEALSELDRSVCEKQLIKLPDVDLPERVFDITDAKKMPAEYAEYEKAAGRISAEYVWAYPPGIPLIIPGEKVSQELTRLFKAYERCGFTLKGGSKRKAGKILVIK